MSFQETQSPWAKTCLFTYSKYPLSWEDGSVLRTLRPITFLFSLGIYGNGLHHLKTLIYWHLSYALRLWTLVKSSGPFQILPASGEIIVFVSHPYNTLASKSHAPCLCCDVVTQCCHDIWTYIISDTFNPNFPFPNSTSYAFSLLTSSWHCTCSVFLVPPAMHPSVFLYASTLLSSLPTPSSLHSIESHFNHSHVLGILCPRNIQ